MSTLNTIFAAVFLVAIIWYLVTTMRRSPEAFSKTNLARSFHSMGILALILIGFIWLIITVLNRS